MPLTAGQRLAFYEILEPLGAGGMGEVYRARDTRLEREVAIKVLPEELAGDDERLRRFEREAKTLASLNHANVAGIHGVDSDGDTYFLALELVPGEDLAERLRRGPLPVDEAIDVCRQIAEGLEAAHEAGVVHRDLKPANVRLTPEGTAKLLDFGLAKPLRVRVDDGSASTTESDSFTATAEGVVLGTPTYMSPEQARGKAIDRRTDLWALGCVLYECLAGRRAFGGESFPDVLAAIAGEDPDWTRLPALPRRVDELLRRMLVKDPRSRLRDAGEARVQLELARGELAASPSPESGQPAAPARGARRSPRALVGVALLAGALGIFAGTRVGSGAAPDTEAGPPTAPLHTELLLPDAAPLAFGAAAFGFDSPLIALSPDGRTLVHVGRDADGESHLHQRDLTGNGDSVRIDGTAGAITACFSPDGEQLAFLTDDELLRISLDGGRPVALAAASEPSRVLWKEPERIHFLQAYANRLTVVPATGGDVQELFSTRGRVRVSDILPDGRLLASVLEGSSTDFSDLILCEVDEFEGLSEQDPAQLRSRIVLENAYDVRYHPSGRLVYANGEALHTVDFDLAQGRPVGDPRTVARGVAMDGIAGNAQYALSDSGALVYVDGRDVGTGGIGWVDRDGGSGFLDVDVQRYRTLDLSPDGRTIAIAVGGVDDTVELVEVATGVVTPLLDRGVSHPLFSHDGARLQLSGSDRRTMRIRSLAGDRPPLEIDLEPPFRPSAWTPDDDGVLLVAYGSRTTEVERLDLATGGSTPALSTTGSLDWSYCFSPDGSHLAYASNRSGRNEVYVRAWPDGLVEHLISRDGGIEVRWCENGDLIWRWGDVWLGTRVTTEPELSWERPEPWFATDFVDTPGVSFDVTGDGQRLYVVKHPEPPQGLRLGHVLGW